MTTRNVYITCCSYHILIGQHWHYNQKESSMKAVATLLGGSCAVLTHFSYVQLSPCSFNFYAEYIMRNAALEETQAGIKIAGRNINNLRDAEDTTLMAEKWRGTQKPLDESESGEWKSWLKAQHSENENYGMWSHHFMRNRWGNSGNSVRLYFSGLQNHFRWWLQPWN